MIKIKIAVGTKAIFTNIGSHCKEVYVQGKYILHSENLECMIRTEVPDTEPLVELALVLCSSCPFYRQWRTGPI